MNYVFIAACALAFVYQLTLQDAVSELIDTFGFVPLELTRAIEGEREMGPVVLTMFVSMFLHGGWFHIIGNLLYLRVFGDNVEDRFGHVGFALFYVASGMVGALAQCAFDPESPTPMIGASGAVAGILGAYIVMFPKARILTLFPVIIVLTFIEVPAFIFLGIWAIQQFLNGYLTLEGHAQGAGGGIAWFAHAGGFTLGMVAGTVTRLIRRRRRRRS